MTVESTGPITLEPGDKVEHPKWGLGAIIHRTGAGDNTKVIVLFQKEGQKTLMVKYAKLKKVGSGAPIPKSATKPTVAEIEDVHHELAAVHPEDTLLSEHDDTEEDETEEK